MTKPFDPIPTSFGTVGLLQRQTRQLLNGRPIPDDLKVDDRAVGFCLADSKAAVLPSLLDTRAWMYLEEDSDEDPVLVLPATASGVATYLVANLNERATIAPLATAVRLDYCRPCDREWMTAFTPAIPMLPRRCSHLNPELPKCERHSVIVLQGSYDNHMRAVETALKRCAGGVRQARATTSIHWVDGH